MQFCGNFQSLLLEVANASFFNYLWGMQSLTPPVRQVRPPGHVRHPPRVPDGPQGVHGVLGEHAVEVPRVLPAGLRHQGHDQVGLAAEQVVVEVHHLIFNFPNIIRKLHVYF